MTDLTERERQIVAWLVKDAWKLPHADLDRCLDIADAIERGEPWGEQS